MNGIGTAYIRQRSFARTIRIEPNTNLGTSYYNSREQNDVKEIRWHYPVAEFLESTCAGRRYCAAGPSCGVSQPSRIPARTLPKDRPVPKALLSRVLASDNAAVPLPIPARVLHVPRLLPSPGRGPKEPGHFHVRRSGVLHSRLPGGLLLPSPLDPPAPGRQCDLQGVDFKDVVNKFKSTNYLSVNSNLMT